MAASKFEATRAAITARFQAGFVQLPVPDPPALPVEFLPCAYDNQPFSNPKESAWARFHIVEGDRTNAAVGVDFQRSVGVIYLQIFVPENGGTKPATDCGDKLASIFDNADFGPAGLQIICRTVSLRRIGKHAEGGWMQHNAQVNYQADATP